MLLCGMTANAQTKVLNPDEADYFIKGNLNIQKNASNEIVYTLTNVSTKGITFTMKDVFEGEETEREEIEFDFANATTTYPGGFENNRLNYWRFDEYEQIWIPESEVRQGEMQNTINKYINIMLVLDCSHSLGDGYNVVKSSAKGVIDRLYSASPNGNIRVGIIGFSKIGLTDKQTYRITALNSTTRDNMKEFINNFEKDEDKRKGTALYYSLDKSIEMLENDSKLIKEEDYSGSYIITFTDGLDQQSQNIDKDILTSDKYYKHIRPLLQGDARKKIYNKNITHFVRSLKGNDITSDKLEAKFDNDLKAICDDYDKLQNINELSNAFSHILDNLIKKNLELQCFVPKAFEGKVGWTFDEKIIVDIPHPKKENKFFLGINAGVGTGIHRGHDWNTGVEEYPSLQYSLGLDMSFPINRTLSLGAFASVGMETSKVVNNPTDKIDVSIGPLVTLNFKNKSVFLIGAGLNVYNHSQIPFFDVFGEPYAIMENDKFFNIGVTSRIGCQFPSKFYIMGEFIFNDARNMDDNLRFWASCYDYSEYYYKYVDFHCKNVAVLIHFGYRIF